MSEKYYTLGTHNTEQWAELHAELIADGNTYASVPSREVTVEDEKLHSPTRGSYLLTLEEATALQSDERVKFINESPEKYPETYMPPWEELHCATNNTLTDRWPNAYNNYQMWTVGSSSVQSNFSNAEPTINRTTALYRMQTKQNPWKTATTNENVAISSKVQQVGAGENVDIICADNASWIGHTEFINSGVTNAVNPADYVGGNVLPGNGICDCLDLVLDAPYYIDPDWFNADNDPEYNNGAIIDLTGDGSNFFSREVTVNGVRIVAAGTVGGQTAVPDAFVEKVARMFELFTDPNGAGISEASQRTFIKTLSGDAGTYHAAVGPTLQRVARGAGADYTPNFLTDAGIASYNLSPLFDSHVANDMVWYLNSDVTPGTGDEDAQEVIEHVFHTLHMHGLDAVSLKMYPTISSDWASGPLYAAMEEAYDAGKWDSSGYGGNAWKTDGDAFEVAAKEYLFLLNFGMFEYSSLWDGGSLAPEWTDDMRTPAGIQSNNPLGYALHNTYIAPVISKPSLTTIRTIFQDGDVGDPTIAGASGYNVTVNNKLTTRWDGTIVPVESVARTWWQNSNQRSASLSAFGNIPVSNNYTRDRANGSNTTYPTDGDHGTQCASLIFGRTHGWAYNANKWILNLYGAYHPGSMEIGFDVQKVFHQYKPVNPTFGTKDPTMSSNSWGYRASDKDGSHYYWRTNPSVAYGGTFDEPGFISWLGATGDSGRWKSEMYDNSMTQAGDELTQAGVIFVAAAGNSNQQQVNPDHPNYDNRISNNDTDTFYQDTFSEFGFNVTGSTNRRGFPQHIGKTESQTAQGNTTVKFPVINIGALDDDMTGSFDQDRKVNYSDMGNAIDLYAPADGTLAATKGTYGLDVARTDDSYSGLTVISGCRDTRFSGTSAACPVACGFLALVMQYNRGWTYEELRNWIQNNLEEQPTSDMYEGVEVTSPTASWSSDYNALQGSSRRILYQATIPVSTVHPDNTPLMTGAFTFSGGLTISKI